MKIVKKLILFLLILLTLMVGGLVIVGLFYGDEIKNLIVTNLNKNIKTEIEVSNVEFSVLESFPNASIVFSDVVILAVNAKNDTLLTTEKLSAKFNLIDLYRKNYNLIGLGLKNGFCRMVVDNSGQENYVFWSESDSTANPVSIQLENVELEKMQFSYVDYSKNLGVSFLIEDTKLQGDFKNQVFNLIANTTLKSTNIQSGETTIIDNRNLFISLDGDVNQNESQLNFNSGDLGVDGMNIGITGDLSYGEESNLNLFLNSSNTDLEKAIALLPKNAQKNLERFEIDGNAILTGTIKGDYSASISPFYQVDFNVDNGLFSDKKSDVKFSNMNLNGSITNGSERTLESTKLILSQFSTKLNEGKIDGKLTLENFDRPIYSYEGNVAFGLKEITAFIENPTLKNSSGKVSSKISVSGKLASIDNYTIKDWKNSKIEGNVTLEKIAFSLTNRPQKISSINGQLAFNNKNLVIENLKGLIDDSEFLLDGKFNNLIPYLIEEEENLLVDATLNSPYINLAGLLKANESENNESYELNISEKITVYLKLNVAELIFNKFNLRDLKGNLLMRDKRIDARNISFDAQEGKVRGDLFIKEKNNQLSIISEAEFRNVDIRKTFNSFGNFGQNSLRSEHLKGVATIDLSLNTLWSKTFEIDTKSIKANVDFTVNNGELLDYKPLEALSNFVELEELKAIQFQQLQNQILIQNELITIPRFEILSSAMNMSVAGTHSFNNNINYHITLLLSEILGKKVKKPAAGEFGYVVDDGLSKKSKLFLKVAGTVDEPKISYDTKELKNTLSKKFDDEKKTVKSILKEEFGLFKKDTTVKKLPNEKPSKSPFSVEIDSSYIKPNKKKNTQDKANNAKQQNETKKKSKFGKFLDKIAQPNDEEFVAPIDN